MDYKTGEIYSVNKPLGWSSFDVVNKIRFAFRNAFGAPKRYKVGHAGTLDPLADGLLIVCTGKQTKKIESFLGKDKSYTGTITFGKTTPSYDLEHDFDQEFGISNLSESAIIDAAKKMVGESLQRPPIFSAKKVKGKKAYDLARAGKEVTLEAKLIHIKRFEIVKLNLPDLNFDITCSKGTYIRSIANDLGKAVNNGAHLSALKRTAIGDKKLADAWELPDLIAHIEQAGKIASNE